MHFQEPNKISRRRGPFMVLSKLFSPVIRSSSKASNDTVSLCGCIMIKPIPIALQSVFKNVGNELSYRASTGDEVIATFSDSKRSINSGIHIVGYIDFLVYLRYNCRLKHRAKLVVVIA